MIVYAYISKNYNNIIPYLVCSNSKVIIDKSVTVANISNGILDFDIKDT